MPRRRGQTFKPRALSRVEIYRAIKMARNLRDKALIAFLFLTGARKSEALEVTSDMIRREGDFLIVRMPIKKRKEEAYKVIPIPLSDPFAGYILDYLRYVPKGVKLFPITPQRVWQILKSVGISPHELRHSRLTEISHYMPSFEVMRFAGWRLGHKTADTYIHLYYDSFKEPLVRAGERAREELLENIDRLREEEEEEFE